MSLSKYYKSSNSFQPEELFKPVADGSFKRTQTLLKQPGAFQSGPPPLQADTAPPKQTEPPPPQSTPVPEKTIKKDVTDDQKEKVANRQPEPPKAVEPAIDLSNYIEISAAELQAEAAYRKGLAEGQEKADKDLGDAVRALVTVCQQLDSVRETIINNSSSELKDFALAIAERILRISLAEQDHTIILTLEEALQRAVKSEEFTVYVHPEDYETVTAKAPDIVAGLRGLNNIVIKRDPSIERGGAKIESENCVIDATISSQFDTIREEVKKKQ